MTVTTIVRVTAATAIAAAAVAPVALAGGEPKNEWPFTHGVAVRTPAQVKQSQSAQAAVISGERKNQMPFTRSVLGGALPKARQSASLVQSGVGEPKTELPFTRPAPTTPIVIHATGGFHWGDAGIGAAGTIGLVFVALGGAALRGTHGRRLRTTGV
jgi:hypothetical protein